jgi:GT2 family glycosyltransferase
MKRVTVSIVTYKNHAVTNACLRSLEELSLSGITLSVVIVNNDTEKAFTYKWAGKGECVILDQKKNVGFAGGHNIALRRSEENSDYVLILNNDTVVAPDCLQALVAAAEELPRGGIFAPKIYFARGHEFHKNRYAEDEKGKVLWYAGGSIDWHNLILSHNGVDEVDNGQYDVRRETQFASGCCMLLRTEAIKKTGMFDERYFLYFEDSDLNERIKRTGYSVHFIPEATVWHENAGSTGGSGSGLQDYFISRNRLLFGFTYAPLRTKFALLRESLSLLISGRKWQKKGVSDYYLRKFGAGSYNV